MKWQNPLVVMAAASALLGALGGAALAQPADLTIPPATTTEFPAGIAIKKLPGGPVYADAHGRTLYGMDMRTVMRWAPDPALYCKEECTQDWEPLLATGGEKPNIAFPLGFGSRDRQERQEKMQALGYHAEPQEAPDWTIIEGPQGPQWVYKGWHMVFTRRSEAPGSAKYDGADNLTWNTLKYVPPVPEIEAPPSVRTVFVGGDYVLADRAGRVLFTGRCKSDCQAWEPLSGGFASRGVGKWRISRSSDTPQWTYGGQPVFVSQGADLQTIPASAKVLRPGG